MFKEILLILIFLLTWSTWMHQDYEDHYAKLVGNDIVSPTEASDIFENFFGNDTTNNNKAIIGKYECLDFSMDVIKNASKQNIDLELAHIRSYYPNNVTNHYVVAMKSEYVGWILIEPQNDKMIQLSLKNDNITNEIVIIAPEFIKINKTEVEYSVDFSETYWL